MKISEQLNLDYTKNYSEKGTPEEEKVKNELQDIINNKLKKEKIFSIIYFTDEVVREFRKNSDLILSPKEQEKLKWHVRDLLKNKYDCSSLERLLEGRDGTFEEKRFKKEEAKKRSKRGAEAIEEKRKEKGRDLRDRWGIGASQPKGDLE